MVQTDSFLYPPDTAHFLKKPVRGNRRIQGEDNRLCLFGFLPGSSQRDDRRGREANFVQKFIYPFYCIFIWFRVGSGDTALRGKPRFLNKSHKMSFSVHFMRKETHTAFQAFFPVAGGRDSLCKTFVPGKFHKVCFRSVFQKERNASFVFFGEKVQVE